MNIVALAFQAGKEASTWLVGGAKATASDVVVKRLEECSKCEHYKDPRCSKCGCFMTIKAKMATAKCPIGKW
jgi:hypothetical protein